MYDNNYDMSNNNNENMQFNEDRQHVVLTQRRVRGCVLRPDEDGARDVDVRDTRRALDQQEGDLLPVRPRGVLHSLRHPPREPPLRPRPPLSPRRRATRETEGVGGRAPSPAHKTLLRPAWTRRVPLVRGEGRDVSG